MEVTASLSIPLTHGNTPDYVQESPEQHWKHQGLQGLCSPSVPQRGAVLLELRVQEPQAALSSGGRAFADQS